MASFLPTEEQLRNLHNRWVAEGVSQNERMPNIGFIDEWLRNPARRQSIAEGYPIKSLKQQLGHERCRIMYFSMFIDCFGDIYPCCYLFNDNVKNWKLREEYKIASWAHENKQSADDNRLERIWRSSPKFKKIRDTPIAGLPMEACGRCTRHMQQNAFLHTIDSSWIKDEEKLHRSLEVFDDPNDPRFKPVWL